MTPSLCLQLQGIDMSYIKIEIKNATYFKRIFKHTNYTYIYTPSLTYQTSYHFNIHENKENKDILIISLLLAM